MALHLDFFLRFENKTLTKENDDFRVNLPDVFVSQKQAKAMTKCFAALDGLAFVVTTRALAQCDGVNGYIGT